MTAHRSRNLLYYGDNLDIVRRYVPDESVDLIYLDPPFNSNQDYNVLFAERDGTRAAAQIKAFEDTWHWDQSAAAAYRDAVLAGGKVADTMQAFRALLGESDMMAYLTMMAPRLVELRRVLKNTGSIYLHCDPTASHYLKLLLDGVFGGLNFRNEIVWTRTISKSLMTRRLPSNHDIIFTYQKTGEAKWNLDAVFVPYDPDQLDEKTARKYCHRDPDGRVYRWDNLINPNRNRPNLTYEFLGVAKVWRWTQERMQEAYESGLIVQTKPGAVPQLKRYLDEQRGRPLGDVWNDIPPINSQAVERLGYPTQKPEALLTRIINASSNPGDTVLDPFCGCGTAIAVAQRLGRRWIGIDITHIAITLIKARMADTFLGRARYNVIGEPVTPEDAATLAAADPFQFQLWALGLVGARPADIKKGADRGIDGRIFFFDDASGKARQIVISVKAGHIMRAHVHELRGVIEREGAAIGVLISLDEPTRPMREESAAAGFYESTGWGKSFPRIQLRTVAELLAGKALERPPSAATFKKAPLARADSSSTPDLFDE